jgi:hypothetical protein
LTVFFSWAADSLGTMISNPQNNRISSRDISFRLSLDKHVSTKVIV